MKNDLDLARETGQWLKQGSRPLPASVLDGTMSAVAETQQLSGAAPRWTIRFRQAIAVSVAAAAAVLAVGVSINLLSSLGVGVGPSSRPSPSHHPRPSSAASASVGASASPAPAGKIAFTSDRDGNPEIYVMNADGSGLTNVTNSPGNDGHSAWSPDGSRVAFTSDRDGNGEVYVVNADGSGLTRLSNDPCEVDMLAWSPDGSRIAFISGGRPHYPHAGGEYTPPPVPAGCPSTMYVVNADGSGLTNLTSGLDDDLGAWSPDGARIAFTSSRDGNQEIYVVNADGTGLTNLSNSPGFDDFSDNTLADGPAWSPDSSRVSFVSDRECKVVGGKLDVYVVNADGSSLTNLGHAGPIINGGVVDCVPSDPISRGYDPDGAHIALAFNPDGNESGNLEIYVMNADGSGLTRLTTNPAHDSNPVLSPDGSRIAFSSDRDGQSGIYVINADGSGLTLLTNKPGFYSYDADLVWSPDSSRIALNGNGEIYVVNADGSGLTNLTNNLGGDYEPIWSPAR